MLIELILFAITFTMIITITIVGIIVLVLMAVSNGDSNIENISFPVIFNKKFPETDNSIFSAFNDVGYVKRNKKDYTVSKILYKAKRVDDKEWVEGYLKTDIETGTITYIKDSDYHYRVDPKTICKYLGYEDAGGNKVFESDFFLEASGGIFEDEVYYFVVGNYHDKGYQEEQEVEKEGKK